MSLNTSSLFCLAPGRETESVSLLAFYVDDVFIFTLIQSEYICIFQQQWFNDKCAVKKGEPCDQRSPWSADAVRAAGPQRTH